MSTVRSLPLPGSYPCGLTWDGGLLWHSDQEAARLFALDPGDGTVVREFECPEARADLAFDGKRLCQVGGRPKRLVLIDPETGEVTGRREVPPPSGRLTGVEMRGEESVWMVLRGPTVVQLREYATMTVLREFPVPGDSPSGLTWTGDVVVYGDFQQASLHAIAPETGEHLGAAVLPGPATGLTWDGQHVWYCDFHARSLRAVRLDAILG